MTSDNERTMDDIKSRLGYLEIRNKKNEGHYLSMGKRFSLIENRLQEIVLKKHSVHDNKSVTANLGSIVDMKEDIQFIKSAMEEMEKVMEDMDKMKEQLSLVRKAPHVGTVSILIKRINELERGFKVIKHHIPMVKSVSKPCLNQTCKATSTHAYFKHNLTNVKYTYCDEHGNQSRMFPSASWMHVRLEE